MFWEIWQEDDNAVYAKVCLRLCRSVFQLSSRITKDQSFSFAQVTRFLSRSCCKQTDSSYSCRGAFSPPLKWIFTYLNVHRVKAKQVKKAETHTDKGAHSAEPTAHDLFPRLCLSAGLPLICLSLRSMNYTFTSWTLWKFPIVVPWQTSLITALTCPTRELYSSLKALE